MTEKVVIEFTVINREKFLAAIQKWDDQGSDDTYIVGFRADDALDKRVPLRIFMDAMEVKLRKNEHKTTWREKPIEALFRLMQLEMEEFRVALEFFAIKEARAELPDIANFAMFLYDRLGMLDQDKGAGETACIGAEFGAKT